MLIGGENRQFRILVGLPCQRRGDEITVILQIVRLKMGVAGHTRQAIGKTVAIRDRPTNIEHRLVIIEAADLRSDFAETLESRPLADEIDEATGITLTVKHRGRPANDFHPLQTVDLIRRRTGRAHQPQTVEELQLVTLKAANARRIETWIRPKRLRDDARHIIQRLAEITDILRIHLIPGDDGNRLRRLDQGSPRLGGASAGFCHIALHRRLGVLIFRAVHGDGLQHRRSGFLRKGNAGGHERHIGDGSATARQNGNVFGFSLHAKTLHQPRRHETVIFLENLSHLITQGADCDPISETGFFQNY
ncbi:hypothetical protein D3C80_876780 [compost metagenome]